MSNIFQNKVLKGVCSNTEQRLVISCLANRLMHPITTLKFLRFKQEMENLTTNGVLCFYQDKKTEWKISFANQAFLRGIHAKREDIEGHDLSEIIEKYVDKTVLEKKRKELFNAFKNPAESKQIELPFISPGAKNGIRVVSFRPEIRDFGVFAVMQDTTYAHKLKEMLAEQIQWAKDFTDSSPIGLFEARRDTTITFANKALKEFLGYDDDDVRRGIKAIDVIIPELREQMIANQKKRENGELTEPTKYEVMSKSGERLPVEVFVTPVLNENGELISFRGALVDTRARRARKAELEKALKEAEAAKEFFREAFETIFEGVVIVGKDNIVRYANPSILRLLGYTMDELLGKNAYDFIPDKYHDLIPKKNKGNETYELEFRHSTGRLVSVENQTRIVNYMGERCRLIAFWDITERKKIQELLEKAANEDMLTGAYTMRKFRYDFPGAVKRARRNKKNLILFTIDANNLRLANNKFGHDQGDKLLISLVDALKSVIRREDSIYRRATSGGADEFLVIMENIEEVACTDTEKRINEVIKKLREFSKKYYEETGINLPFEASFGYSCIYPGVDDLNDQIITERAFADLVEDPAELIKQLEDARYINIKSDLKDIYVIQSKIFFIKQNAELDEFEINYPLEIKAKILDRIYSVPGIYKTMQQLEKDSDIAMYIAKRESEKKLQANLKSGEKIDDGIKLSEVAYYKDTEKK